MRVTEFMGTWLVLGGCGSAVLAVAFPHVGIGAPGVGCVLKAGATYHSTTIFRFSAN
jgi:hypothetical protein